jgi:cation transport protein ChaC
MRLTPELVALCHREVPDAGAGPDISVMSEADYPAAAAQLLTEGPAEAFWIFAYGSLIWKPTFEHIGRKSCSAPGWRRSFCLEINRWRGSPEVPGLMMALESGEGSCDGALLRVADHERHKVLEELLRREVEQASELASTRWLNVTTEEGTIRALTFYADPVEVPCYSGNLPPHHVASVLARACGHWGSGADYLYNTVRHLEEMGIHDEGLWHLQGLVAAEIEALHDRNQG